ncbi:receptor-type tyrosine-protein phosphatase C isoform X6 [Electrophorus electricus]|uniref:receptor-type tyrosine-protein phosphatase C isoform X6 n=1 Tax=Electrophorus electricus TaxID=8005 RepID=UPI0015D0451A|nr:receptor-type tyrosine-protein phosphatase C isoform X6 [Electrophorus electricus]
MAKFLGLMFLVLTGLAICILSAAGNNSNNSIMTTSTQPASFNTLSTSQDTNPPLINSQQHTDVSTSETTKQTKPSAPSSTSHSQQTPSRANVPEDINMSTSSPPHTPSRQQLPTSTAGTDTNPPLINSQQHTDVSTSETTKQTKPSAPSSTSHSQQTPTRANVPEAINMSTSSPPHTPSHQHPQLPTTTAGTDTSLPLINSQQHTDVSSSETTKQTKPSAPSSTSHSQQTPSRANVPEDSDSKMASTSTQPTSFNSLSTSPGDHSTENSSRLIITDTTDASHTASSINTILPPRMSTTTEASPTFTSDSSSLSTASPTLTSTEAGSCSTCESSVTVKKIESKHALLVTFEEFNKNNCPSKPYFMILKNNASNKTITSATINMTESIFEIPLEKLEPCQYYNVSLNHTCTLKKNIISSNVTYWDKPTFNFTKNVSSEFYWTNRNETCAGDVTFSCDSIARPYKENEHVKLEPYHNYSCNATYAFFAPETFPVYFECEWKNSSEPKLEASTNSIMASWSLTSPNCDEQKVTYNVTCESKQEKTDSCIWNQNPNSCNVPALEFDSHYTCTIRVDYNNSKNVHSITMAVETLSGKPEISEKNFVMPQHNAFYVTYHVKWNGKNGTCYLNLTNGNKVESTKQNTSNEENCSFLLENLYYLTTYTFLVYAENGKGNKSDVQSTQHTTQYNYKAVLGFLGFLIFVTSLALLFVMYKIFALQRKRSSEVCEMDHLLPQENLLHVEPISADALVDTYRKKIADEGRLFMEEFQSIPRIFSNYTVKEAKKSENQSKNRYVDILPYDYNRVSLSNGGRHDYINASFIEGYKEPNKYIAAQGPKDETVEDFWRMVWEQKSSIIVMVTRCEEGNKNKCAQYWPSVERETEIFDDFVVKIKHEENCPDYIIRQLSLMNRKEKAAERDVTHIQFMSWPDHGVPGDPGLLLKLRRRVNSFKNIFSGPIVVHCSAGVGRTGTYIGIDAMIESLEAEGRMDIYGYVAKLRRQRCLMVQVESQYVLIHTALIEYNQFGETEISLMDFHSTVNTLKQREGNEPSLLELEYQKLPKFKNWRLSNLAATEENKKKNRSSIVPYDFNRVLVKLEEEEGHNSDAEDEEDYSSDEDDETSTKYINASYVNGYWSPKSLITAQGPLDSTVEDFLQMLFQKQVPAVIMLSDCMENGKEFCAQYWAEEKKVFGEMEVEVKETESTPTYIRRRLQIQSTKVKESVTSEQYHFLKWAGHELPANPLDLIDMMKSIRQNVGHGNSRDNISSPIVVHCNDGSSRSGIFCALWKLLDSADTERLVDIFQVAKGLRKERLGMFTSLEQYQFLYEALQAAFPVQNGEVKKAAASPDSVQVINEASGTTSADQVEAANSQAPENQAIAPPENQAVENPNAATASPSPQEGTCESSCVPEKAPSETTTNGPTVTVEV